MVDFHCHIGRMWHRELNELYAIPKKAGGVFLYSILQGVDEVDEMFATLYASPHVAYEDSLDWLLSEVAPYKELVPVPVIHPHLEGTTRLLKQIDPARVPGIKIHCASAEFGHYSLGDHSLLAPLFSYAQKSDLILFVHTDRHSCLACELAPLLEEFQGIVVLLHCCREGGGCVLLVILPSFWKQVDVARGMFSL